MLGNEKKDNYPTSTYVILIFSMVALFAFQLWQRTLDHPVETQLFFENEITLDDFQPSFSLINNESCFWLEEQEIGEEIIYIWDDKIRDRRVVKFYLLGDTKEIPRNEGSYLIRIENGQIEFLIDEICQGSEGSRSMLFYLLSFNEVNLSLANTFSMPIIEYDGNFKLELMLPPDDEGFARYIKEIDSVGELTFDLNKVSELPHKSRDWIEAIFIYVYGTGKLVLGSPKFSR